MNVSSKSLKQATELRQEGLVAAALMLAAQRCPGEITTGDLAKAVGISQGAVFRHFVSKEAIWLAVLDWTAEALMTRLAAAAKSSLRAETPSHALHSLRSVFMAHVEFVVAHPGVPRVIFQELQHAKETPLKVRVRGVMQRYRTFVMELLQNARAQNLLAPDIDLDAAVILFLGSVQGLIMQSMASGQINLMTTQAADVFAIYLRGIRATTLEETQ